MFPLPAAHCLPSLASGPAIYGGPGTSISDDLRRPPPGFEMAEAVFSGNSFSKSRPYLNARFHKILIIARISK